MQLCCHRFTSAATRCETVRKGGTSHAASVDMTVYGRRNGSKISIWRSGGLCCTRIQDFSDGLSRQLCLHSGTQKDGPAPFCVLTTAHMCSRVNMCCRNTAYYLGARPPFPFPFPEPGTRLLK